MSPLFQFPHLLQEVKQFLASIASAKRVTTLLANLRACFHGNVQGAAHGNVRGAARAGSMLHEVRSFLDSSRHFMDQMQTRYLLYRDLLVPFWAGLAQVGTLSASRDFYTLHTGYLECIRCPF